MNVHKVHERSFTFVHENRHPHASVHELLWFMNVHVHVRLRVGFRERPSLAIVGPGEWAFADIVREGARVHGTASRPPIPSRVRDIPFLAS